MAAQIGVTAQALRTQADFCIEIGFQRHTDGPERVFKAMLGLIESCKSVDRLLVQSVDVRLEPLLLLEDIEAGSIRTWLRQQIEDVDDDALKKLEWKPLVGHYLVKAKYRAINFLAGRTAITSRAEIKELQNELFSEAQKVTLKPIPIHAPLPERDIVQVLELLSAPLLELHSGDSAKYITETDEAPFNLSLSIIPDAIEDLIVRETITNESVIILKVKRPDYLGEAMWDFRYEGHPIPAKVLDIEWLRRFQERKEQVWPGDAIRARVNVEVRYGYDGEVIGKRYTILKVLEVIPFEPPEQVILLP